MCKMQKKATKSSQEFQVFCEAIAISNLHNLNYQEFQAQLTLKFSIPRNSAVLSFLNYG